MLFHSRSVITILIYQILQQLKYIKGISGIRYAGIKTEPKLYALSCSIKLISVNKKNNCWNNSNDISTKVLAKPSRFNRQDAQQNRISKA